MTTTRIHIPLTITLALCALFALAFVLPGSASAHTTGTSHSHASSTKAINLTCMQAAVTEREEAVAAAFDEFAASMKTAHADRKAALIAAWGKTDMKERNAAVKAAWKNFREDRVDARKELGKDKKAAWKEFRTTAKTECKSAVPKEEGESNDTDA